LFHPVLFCSPDPPAFKALGTGKQETKLLNTYQN
jgi:hypothetical protein